MSENKELKTNSNNEQDRTGEMATSTTCAATTKSKSNTTAMATYLSEKLGLLEAFSNDKVSVFAGKAKDKGTLEVEIELIAVDKDGNASTTRKYKKGKLGNKKIFNNLANIDGISENDVKSLYDFITKNIDSLPQTEIVGDTVSALFAYRELLKHAKTFSLNNMFKVEGGYLNINCKYLDQAISDLELKIKKLDLKRGLKRFGLSRVNSETTGHMYDYKIKKEWYLSIRAEEI